MNVEPFHRILNVMWMALCGSLGLYMVFTGDKHATVYLAVSILFTRHLMYDHAHKESEEKLEETKS